MSRNLRVSPIISDKYVAWYYTALVRHMWPYFQYENIDIEIIEGSEILDEIDEEIIKTPRMLDDIVNKVINDGNCISISSKYHFARRRSADFRLRLFGYNNNYSSVDGTIAIDFEYEQVAKRYYDDNIFYAIPKSERSLNGFDGLNRLEVFCLEANILSYFGRDISLGHMWSGCDDCISPADNGIIVYHKNINDFIIDIDRSYGWYHYGLFPAYSLMHNKLTIDIVKSDIDNIYRDKYSGSARYSKDSDTKKFYEGIDPEMIGRILGLDNNLIKTIFARSIALMPQFWQINLPNGGILLSSHSGRETLLPFYRYLYDELSARV